MDPFIMEVREGREVVDPVMGGHSGAARRWNLILGVRGGQRGSGPCYGGFEGGSEEVDTVIVEVRGGTE